MQTEETNTNTNEATETTGATETLGTVVDRDGQKVDVNSVDDSATKADSVDRPEWLPEKFKSPEDMAKSYKELEKTLKDKGLSAPDIYEVVDSINIPENDEAIDAFAGVAKEAGLTNRQFNAVLKYAQDNELLNVQSPEDVAKAYEEELNKLGSEKDKILGRINSYKSKLSVEEQTVLDNMIFTADEAKIIDKLIRDRNFTIPTAPNVPASDKDELNKQLDKVLANPNIRYDINLQKEATDLAKRIAGAK